MHITKTFKPRLNKFNLRAFVFLLFLIFYTSSYSYSANLKPFETIIKPEIPTIGDTVSIKIPREKNNKQVPKIFFEKNKLPVFVLSESWFRTFLPLSANYKSGKYLLEIFYKEKVKRIDLFVKDKKYPLQELILPKQVAELKASRIEKALVAKSLSTLSNTKLWSGKFIYPSNGPQSTAYGVKRKVNGVINPDYFHKGLDFAALQGSNVVAPENGKVILAGHETKGFVVNGNCIFIDHGHGVITGYLHLSSILVKEGDFIKKSQIIGKVGSTGIASGPHLHWGVYVLGKTVEPLNWTSMIID
ncbi:MAG: M23 family metallopeptidase [Candidatus Melainabacteria bacterium]|nr:M23 family metallopeptidase [Candidatus Melainabacteria bacterium]